MNKPLTYDEKMKLKCLLYRYYKNNVDDSDITLASMILMKSINRELISEVNK